MSLPTVAIVGRPNVGKSSIFNWLVGRRLAIVDSVAGVTRDRMVRVVEHEGSYFEIIDTGGVGINDIDDLSAEIDQQIEAAIRSAQIVLFVVDIRQGLAPLDAVVAKRLHAIGKTVVFAANKADEDMFAWQASDFLSLGFGEPICISAQNFRGKHDLLDQVVRNLPPADHDEVHQATADPEFRIAIVGRRNVGKSTFINALTESDRMIVSEVAGTTRDSVDVRIQMDGKTLILIDTPGFRRRRSVRSDIDFYSTHRAQRSIRYADVVLMFFDAAEEMSKVDKQLVNYIEAHHKPVLFVVNKWDLVADKIVTEQWADYLEEVFSTMWYAPVAFITAKDGKNVKKLLNHAQMLHKQSTWRVATGTLNRLLRQAMLLHPPPVLGPRRPRIYFATQVATSPPTIVVKCSDPDSFPKTYRRYLMGVLRDQLKFGEIPIRMFLEKRDSHSGTRPTPAGITPEAIATEKNLLGKDLMENDLLDVDSANLQQWVEAQSKFDRKRAEKAKAEPKRPKRLEEDDEENFDRFWDDEDPNATIEAEEFTYDPPDPNQGGSDDFDPDEFDTKSLHEIYEESLEEPDDESER